MNDINLLPEELRADEERLASQLPGPKPAVAWHLPASPSAYRGEPASPSAYRGEPASPSAYRGEPASPRRPDASVGVGAGQGGPGNGSNQVLVAKPLAPDSSQAKILSAGPFKVRPEVKPQAPIFDLDAEARQSEAKAKQARLEQAKQARLEQAKQARLEQAKQAKNSPAPERTLSQEKKPAAHGATERPVVGGLLGKMLGQNNDPIRRLKPSEFAGSQGFSKSVDVNLIPEGSDLLPNRHFYPYFFYAALGGLAGLGLLFLGLVLYQQRVVNQEKAVTAKVVASETAYNQLKAKEEALSAWSTKAAAIQGLFDNHVYWTKFFEALQSVTTPDVYYSDINTAVDGTVTLSAGANSYVAVAKQFLAYQQAADLIQEVSLADIAGDPADNKITFTVKLQFAPTVFFLTLNNN